MLRLKDWQAGIGTVHACLSPVHLCLSCLAVAMHGMAVADTEQTTPDVQQPGPCNYVALLATGHANQQAQPIIDQCYTYGFEAHASHSLIFRNSESKPKGGLLTMKKSMPNPPSFLQSKQQGEQPEANAGHKALEL